MLHHDNGRLYALTTGSAMVALRKHKNQLGCLGGRYPSTTEKNTPSCVERSPSIFTHAPPLGRLEKLSPMGAAGGRFIRNMTFHPPAIKNKHIEYEAHGRSSAAAKNII